VTTPDCSAGDALLNVRRQLAWEGIEQGTTDFHATEERQYVRDRVFEALDSIAFRVDATIFDKQRVTERLRRDEGRFYQTAWFLHFKHMAPLIVQPSDELLVVAASLGTRKKRDEFHGAVRNVVQQVAPMVDFRTAFWSAASEPCLWVADYCSWAIQRKWERGDARSYVLIESKVQSEFNIFR
jgi:hypothetical protein